ncbi:MAG: hypothetical protein Q9166_006951 [cf. Caloplaca sp. 2 TL-2023]
MEVQKIEGVKNKLTFLKHAIPDKTERFAYHDWCTTPFKKQVANAPGTEQQYCPDGPSLINHLHTTDYTDPNALVTLAQLFRLDHVPAIVIGSSRNVLYGVLLARKLHANKQVTDIEKRRVLVDIVLGMNANVEPVLKRSDFYSSESHHSTESEYADITSFNILSQIGSLMAYEGKGETVSEAVKDTEHWKNTGFIVVSDITTGRARGVWIVYNFWPIDISGDRYHIEEDDEWGWLPNYDGDSPEDYQFSVAKIADNLIELKPSFVFKLRHRLRHEPELVRVVKDGMGRLQRQMVEMEDSR